jgi:hypothetical protein
MRAMMPPLATSKSYWKSGVSMGISGLVGILSQRPGALRAVALPSLRAPLQGMWQINEIVHWFRT